MSSAHFLQIPVMETLYTYTDPVKSNLKHSINVVFIDIIRISLHSYLSRISNIVIIPKLLKNIPVVFYTDKRRCTSTKIHSLNPFIEIRGIVLYLLHEYRNKGTYAIQPGCLVKITVTTA